VVRLRARAITNRISAEIVRQHVARLRVRRPDLDRRHHGVAGVRTEIERIELVDPGDQYDEMSLVLPVHHLKRPVRPAVAVEIASERIR